MVEAFVFAGDVEAPVGVEVAVAVDGPELGVAHLEGQAELGFGWPLQMGA